MWTSVLVALALAHAGHGFTMFGFSVPSTPEIGATVNLEARYRLNRGEFIRKMKWYKDDVVFMSYSEGPQEFFDWTPIPGVNIDQAASTPSKVVITDVGAEASGQYTLEVQVHGPGGNVANIVNGQYMDVGGTVTDTLATRFGSGGFGGGLGSGGTFFQSSSVGSSSPGNTFQSSVGGTSFQSSSAGGLGPDTLGTRTTFQSSSAGGSTGIQGAVPGVSVQSTDGVVQGTVPGVSFQSTDGAVQGTGFGTAFQSAGGAVQGTGPGGAFQSFGGTFQGAVPGGFVQSTGTGGNTAFQGVVPGTGVGPLGVRTSFQSASAGGEVGPQPALAIQSALAQTQAQVQQAVNQINQLQAALANIGL